MAAKVEIYTSKTCSYCRQAKALLKEKGVEFIEYSIDGDKMARAAMAERANGDILYLKFWRCTLKGWNK